MFTKIQETWKSAATTTYTSVVAAKTYMLNKITTDKKAQGIIEYGLILALVALGLVGTMGSMRNAISAKFAEAIAAIKGAKSPG